MIIDCLSKAIFLFIIYNIITILLFGIPKSLSMTYYLFKARTESLKIMFPGMIFLMVIFLMPCLLQLSCNSDFQCFAFLSMLSLLFVGICPRILEYNIESKIHNIAAIISTIFAILWIILVTPYWYVILIIFACITAVAILTKTWKTCYIYWLEIVTFISTFISIIIYYLI